MICGNECVLDASASDATQATCRTPPLVTTYSASTYSISSAGLIHGTWTGSNPTSVDKVHDNVWLSDYTDTAANPWIEIDFPDTQVAVLDSVKILINNLTNKVPFVGDTKLQGFDGSAYVDILTLSNEIHEGWNVFSWDTSKPAYQKYKWTGAAVGSVRFGEVKFYGIVSVANTNAAHVCDVKMIVAGVTTTLNPITYADTHTPTIDSVVPRYGAVQGGETITITGTNFVDGSTSVTIDGITCAIGTVTATEITCTTGSRPGD